MNSLYQLMFFRNILAREEVCVSLCHDCNVAEINRDVNPCYNFICRQA